MSKVTFDGSSKIITVDSGVTTLNVQTDLYSDWKEWVVLSDNSKYLPAFRSVGGDELQTDYFLAPTFFLLNGWRIRPAEENRVLSVIGNIYVDGSSDSPFISTIGNYRVMINSTTSNVVNTIAVGSGVTSQDKTDIIDGVLAGVDDATTIANEVKTTLDPDINILKGLMHSNFRMKNQIYDADSNLLSATVRIYSSDVDCENDVNPIHEYTISATYTNKKLTNYFMKLAI